MPSHRVSERRRHDPKMPKQLPEQIRLKFSHIDMDYETDPSYDTDPYYACEKCGFETNSQDIYSLHIENCSRPQPYVTKPVVNAKVEYRGFSLRKRILTWENAKKVLKWTAMAIFIVVVIFIALVMASGNKRRRY